MPWWRPDCLAAQPAAEAWLATQAGPSVLGTLDADARDFGLQNRKFQIERLRLGLPFAGYVVSVARDFRKARMGLIDDLDRPKWSAADFASGAIPAYTGEHVPCAHPLASHWTGDSVPRTSWQRGELYDRSTLSYGSQTACVSLDVVDILSML